MTVSDNQFSDRRSSHIWSPTRHPIAHPIASTPDISSPKVNPVSAPLGLANDGAHQGTTPPPRARRMRAADVSAIAARLSERDLAVMHSVGEHQFLTGHQITALHFHDHSAVSGPRIARRVLARLRVLRVLGALERTVGGVHAGSSGLIHYVDVVGDQILRGRSGRTTRRPRDPSARFLAHRLAVADTHIDLLHAHRAGKLEIAECTIEPASWRRYPGSGGATVAVKPDLYAETGAGAALVHAWFIEVDLGTESVPTLLRKCHAYEAYRRSGIEQDRTGGFPIVIWSVTHRDPVKAADRRIALTQAIQKDRNLPTQLFRITNPQQLIATLHGGDAS